jgi:hypothetical protein
MIDLEAALDKMDQELREINGNADVWKWFILKKIMFT